MSQQMQHDYFYITTTLPYVNAEPHIGFALEIITADILARYYRALGKQVIFNTGTDEHGQKIYDRSQAEGMEPQAFVDKHAAQFAHLQESLQLSFDRFIRTTDPHHVTAAQDFWRICAEQGFIYKGTYKTLYCVGCELEKQVSELEDGHCPLHPNLTIEEREEENYFFKFSAFQEQLAQLYASNPTFVKPEGKQREIAAFVAGGLTDFSISRLKAKMSWGIPVPGDDAHVMYVWFDALVNYISTLGWPDDTATFERYWPGVQIAGKDNLRQQAAMWQAMLMAAKLPPSKEILINGFISVGGKKMSKSLGNVIAPDQMVERYGSDATRLLLFLLGPVGSDMDVTLDRFDELYTSVLANGLGNLCSRIAKLVSTLPESDQADLSKLFQPQQNFAQPFAAAIEARNFQAVAEWLTDQLRQLDSTLSEAKPWKLEGSQKVAVLRKIVERVPQVLFHFALFMPTTAAQLTTHFGQLPIAPLRPLFPRINES